VGFGDDLANSLVDQSMDWRKLFLHTPLSTLARQQAAENVNLEDNSVIEENQDAKICRHLVVRYQSKRMLYQMKV